MVAADEAQTPTSKPEGEAPLKDSSTRRLLRVGLEWVAELPPFAPKNQSGDVIGGSLELKALLGRGGMGEVWRAFHRTLARDVAVKIIDPVLARDAEFLERFRLEALAAQAVVHKNVVQVREFGVDDRGCVYLTMDLVDGRSLEALLTDARVEGRLLQPAWAVEVMGQVLAGLQAAHEAGVVHRDVKPSNILVSSSQRGMRAQLADFGVAAALPESTFRTRINARITRTGSTVGTLAYMSPEQASGQQVGAASDIYSAGVILYELLTGCLPTEGRNEREFRQNLMTRAPRPMRSVAPEAAVPPALEQAILKALAFEPAERYASATEFAAAIRSALDEQQGPRRRRRGIRRPGPIAVVLAALLVAAVGIWLLARFALPPPGPPPALPPEGPKVVSPPPVDQAEAARRAGVDLVLEIPLGDTVSMQLVFIPAGEFDMGSPPAEEGRRSDEGPRHRVRITRAFYLGATEVTQAQYALIAGSNPSHFAGPDRPVEQVRWVDAVEFCLRLTERERAAGRLPNGEQYRLPTEAEWEYACRAGTQTAFSFGADPFRVSEYAWFLENAGESTQPVRRKRPNPWGLFDLHGNVLEWCQDWHGPYLEGLAVEPAGPESSSLGRVLRGGFWGSPGLLVRSASRETYSPTAPADSRMGFRVVRTVALAPG